MPTSRLAAILTVTCLCIASSMAFAAEPVRKHFGKGHAFTVEELPAGKLKSKLQRLDPEIREKAMKKLHTLEFAAFDAADHFRVDHKGGIFAVCPDRHGNCDGHPHGPSSAETTSESSISTGGTAEEPISPPPPTTESAAGDVLISAPPAYNSKPGATRHIYLDFNGANVTGKSWREVQGSDTWDTWDCKAWDQYESSDPSYDTTTFSTAEQAEMKRIWERVAEDFAPFDVNVTTDVAYDPDTYTGDKNKVGWLLFTHTVDKIGRNCPHYGSGGVAYLGVFGDSNYFSDNQPAWVTSSSPSKLTSVSSMAEAASHEMGHNMGLSHDGTSSLEYYPGHDGTSSAQSWGPIMGTGYGQNVSQWSQGEYTGANLTQDDLAIISGRVPYRVDDHGDAYAGATIWTNSTVDQDGIVERSSNIDYFKFTTAAGTISFNATTYKCDTDTWGGNLDIILELYDSSYNLVTSTNDSGDSNYSAPAAVNASISQSVAAGTYYLLVKPSGAGTPEAPTASGYSVYGSLGQYNITGNYLASDTLFITSPTGGENWMRSTIKEITWLSGINGDVKIELLKGGVASTIIASTPNDGTYPWTIPKDQLTDTDYKIRITSLEPAAVTDQSTSNFTISAPTNDLLVANMDTDPGFAVTGNFEYGTPVSPNRVLAGNTGTKFYDTDLDAMSLVASSLTTFAIDCSSHINVNLTFWSHAFTVSTYRFEVSNDNSTWTELFSQNGATDSSWQQRSYDISSVADGESTVYVRWSMDQTSSYYGGDGLAIDDVSITGSFIPADDIYLTAPNGGETLVRETLNGITWTSGMGGNVKIELLKAGSLHTTIAASTPNDGSYGMMLPSSVAAATDYRVKITSVETPSTSVTSAANFSVVAPSSNILIANLDTDPGFTATGLFEYGTPSSPNRVLSGKTGTKFYDTDLDGTSTDASSLTTFPIDCSSHTNVNLTFWSHAFTTSTYQFEVSNDNSTWTELFSQIGVTNGSWQQRSYDISAVADGESTVYVRWSIDQTFSYYGGDGLAIDDISLTGTFSPASYSYSVAYNGNGNTGGDVPANQIKNQGVNLALASNSGTLTKTGYNFLGWNTAGNGSGTDYSVGNAYTADSALTLYAKWAPNYSTWSGGGTAGADSNGDGIDNGIAWALGATNASENARAKMPTMDNASDPTYFIYTYRRSDAAHNDANTMIAVEYGDSLSGWTNASDDGSNILIAETNDGVASGVDQVQVKIKRSLSSSGKMFARLRVTVTP